MSLGLLSVFISIFAFLARCLGWELGGVMSLVFGGFVVVVKFGFFFKLPEVCSFWEGCSNLTVYHVRGLYYGFSSSGTYCKSFLLIIL